MTEILTRCGYRCDLCPAYDENLKASADRQQISGGWFKYFGFQIPPEEIGCVGCLNEGKHADADCPVRPCVIERKLENCAHCDSFDGCEKLKTRMEFVEARLKELGEIPEEDYRLFIEPYLSKARLLQIRKSQVHP